MASLNDIRRTFLDFFARHGHEKVSSSPLVPQNDPTLMFTNAGMVQFKNVFTGQEKRPYQRAVTSQKCVRAGGKHNDLDNVGYTARHHTFFEMLGNFSFGDYFKEGAITHAWELLTKDYGLPKDKLLVTVYHTDDDAAKLWKKIAGLPDEKIIRIPTNDNFWAMGDTGPCGPCSEIFYDHGDKVAGGPPGSADQDGDRFIEIWNLVFMQYEQVSKEERIDLPKPSIDTGMGLERLAAVLQGQHDNYDTDLFQHIIDNIRSHTGWDGKKNFDTMKPAHKVIADHLRATSFLIADGVLPSNEGRGYVLRRIMRRAMRYAYELKPEKQFFAELVPTLVGEMGNAYPELGRAQALITETIKLEENRFRDMLGRGLKLLDEEKQKLSGKTLPGDVAFKLYDTYGFPLDLTQDVLRRSGISVDTAGFEASMEQQREKARAAWAGSGEKSVEGLWFAIKEKVGATEFLGYHHDRADGVVVALVKDGAEVDSLKKGDEGYLITNQTPFYGESGGQAGDAGWVQTNNVEADVIDTTKPIADFHVHKIKVTNGTLKKGDSVGLAIDRERRNKLRANHSATHLLHKALREVLGDHVTQKGSLVAYDRFRFDFSHTKAMTEEEIRKVEKRVNYFIRQNTDVDTRLMTPDAAISAGAMALFGEKYGEEVRVVTMGIVADDHYSTELCGGTHVSATGDIALFKIISESAIASGVRRIEALTGEAALDYVDGEHDLLAQMASVLKIPTQELPARLNALLEERKQLEQKLSEARKAAVMGGGAEDKPEKVGDFMLLAKDCGELPPKELRDLADSMRKKVGSGVVALTSSAGGKLSLIVAITEDLKGKLNAAELVKKTAEPLGGSGGGKPDFAQAGLPDAGKAQDALASLKQALAA